MQPHQRWITIKKRNEKVICNEHVIGSIFAIQRNKATIETCSRFVQKDLLERTGVSLGRVYALLSRFTIAKSRAVSATCL